ncbi:MAG TPA: hypothetical protein VFG49_03380 [Dyella sp.]|uniref:hypothetical protein n=1 Tax=Dyella sp. TaxID=1869338 RepID=UPI002D77A3AB|nr:hypothetical protein [Dyella sp.]HET6552555.1 hypothetical protein [Dyella sp.]
MAAYLFVYTLYIQRQPDATSPFSPLRPPQPQARRTARRGARDHGTVTGLDGADIVTQLIEHAFQVSQALCIGLVARLLLAGLAEELASAQVKDLAGAKHFRVIGDS